MDMAKTQSLQTRRLVFGTAVVALASTLAVTPAACDSTATIFPQKVQFDYLQVVSAYPGKKNADGSWTRQCEPGPTDGLLSNVAFVSFKRLNTGDASGEDLDKSIRPGDVIDSRTVQGGLPDDIDLTSTGNIAVKYDCIDPQPNTGQCQGAVPAANLDRIDFKENVAGRRDGHNVLILIDQSGSVGGIVDETINFKENRQGDFVPPQNFGNVASDRTSIRLSATRRFIRTLNTEDRYGVLAFGEEQGGAGSNGLAVPCAAAQGSPEADLADCFGKPNEDLWLSTNGIDSLQGQTLGRSNLWDAVDTAFDFLHDTIADNQRSNHIVVVTDGPDTCSGENLGSCQSGCGSTSAAEVLAKVKADRADPLGLGIRVHFVQFESRGYVGRDVRQIEVACESGGHYQYINSEQFPREQTSQFRSAMETALDNVRFALGGHWALASNVAAYTSNAPVPTGTQPGGLYALHGQITLSSASKMVPSDEIFTFGIGQGGENSNDAQVWDRRPVVRKPCSLASDCGGADAACQIVCSPETLTCPGGSAGVAAPELSSCELGAGGVGFCCEGGCQAPGGVCASCQ